MAKLDPHAELIKCLYRECKNAKDTHQRLLDAGVEVCYETVRQWLGNHADDLPTLRSGAGKPRSANPEQLFEFVPKNTDWVPNAGIFPEFFDVLTPAATREYKTEFLTVFLNRFGIKTSSKYLEDTELPLKRFRRLCDLELYLLAYLLGGHGPLVGVAIAEFGARTRAITPMAAKLRDVIMRRNSITVGELRRLICLP